MSNFKFLVTNIETPNVIRVSPNWGLRIPEGIEINGDIVIISGIPSHGFSDYLKFRLSSLISGKEVELINPVVYKTPDNTYTVNCNVLLNGTDISYYFPEIKDSFSPMSNLTGSQKVMG